MTYICDTLGLDIEAVREVCRADRADKCLRDSHNWVFDDSPDVYSFTRESDELKPEWVVNDAAELGVKLGDRCFFLYKGDSIEYSGESEITMYRPVFKREFGECCHPINYSDCRLNGTVSLDDSDEWKPLPKRTGRKSE